MFHEEIVKSKVYKLIRLYSSKSQDSKKLMQSINQTQHINWAWKLVQQKEEKEENQKQQQHIQDFTGNVYVTYSLVILRNYFYLPQVRQL